MPKFEKSPLRKCPKWLLTTQGKELAEHGYKNHFYKDSNPYSQSGYYGYIYCAGFLGNSIDDIQLSMSSGVTARYYIGGISFKDDTAYFFSRALDWPMEHFTQEFEGQAIALVLTGNGKNRDGRGRTGKVDFGVIIPENVYRPLTKMIKNDYRQAVELMLDIFPEDLVKIISLEPKPKLMFRDTVNNEFIRK